MKRHSTIETSPVERWMNTAHKVRLFNINSQDETFYFETSRIVKKDGTFPLNNRIFETSWTLAGKKVLIKYDPFAPERPIVSYENQDYCQAEKNEGGQSK